MDAQAKDNIVTIAAIGLLAYASADIAHHAFGHGAACLALGGRIISLSSIFVNCSLRGAAIDLAGPFANLVLGLVAMLAARMATRASSATRLFYILVAAFNLLWFALQLVFSAATRTDDWAWAMHQFQVAEPIRYGMIAVGALAYLLSVRAIAAQMAPFAHPPARARTIVLSAWLTAGGLACATAALDHNAAAAIFFGMSWHNPSAFPLVCFSCRRERKRVASLTACKRPLLLSRSLGSLRLLSWGQRRFSFLDRV